MMKGKGKRTRGVTLFGGGDIQNKCDVCVYIFSAGHVLKGIVKTFREICVLIFLLNNS